MSELKLAEKTMLLSASAWSLTHCEPTRGWDDQWSLVWRAEEFHGKIGCFIKSKKKPTEARLNKELKKELLRRLRSPLRCDAKRTAYLWLTKRGSSLPLDVKHTGKILSDSLYDLDDKIAKEFYSGNGPRLFMSVTHGWILGELAEIRCLASHLSSLVEKLA